LIQLGAWDPNNRSSLMKKIFSHSGGIVTGLPFAETPDAGNFSGTDWRYCKQTTDPNCPSGYKFWDGWDWQNVPTGWSDLGGVKLYPIGVWREYLSNKTQFGDQSWPDYILPWSDAAIASAQTVLPRWTNTIQTVWSAAFDLKRDQCPSTDNSCCRYHTTAVASFNQVQSMSTAATIVLAPNKARSNAGAWSMGEDRPNMPAHEFGHHLGNPDEYAGGVGVKTKTSDADGLANGIDPTSLMGQNMTTLKARSFETICSQLSMMVDTASGKKNGYTYKAVPPAC